MKKRNSFKKGNKVWMKASGKMPKAERHHAWKGDNASYSAIHYYVRKNKLVPSCCSWCNKKTDKLDLANVSGEYTRNTDDYAYICRSCHMKDDGRMEELHRQNKLYRLKQEEKHVKD